VVQTGPVQGQRAAVITLLVAGFVAACSSQAASPRPSPAAPATSATAAPSPSPSVSEATPAAGWFTYHGNVARTGKVSGLPAAGKLALAWTRRLGAAVYGQPLVIGATVVAATNTNEVVGLDLATGAVRWHQRVGTPLPISEQPCGNINPLGITSTPVYDPRNRLVYVVAQNGKTGHELAALRVSNGQVAFTRSVPSPDQRPAYDQQRGALTLSHGRVYVVFGGHYGDCGPYRGTVVGMPVSGHGAIVSYQVPTKEQGGIWSSGGPVVGPDGTIYVSTGNGATTSKTYDDSDSVTALSPHLTLTSIFAPSDWQKLSDDDLDLGSMSPALLSDGQILQVGKSGTGYLLNSAHLGGIGGQVADGQVCSAFGGAAVSGTVVYVPCYPAGLAAVQTAGNTVRVRWRGPTGAWGSPVVGGGAVWVADWNSGRLYELSPATGAVRQQIGLGGPLPHFVSPTLAGRLLLVGTMTGVVAISGL
jgi:outer membrane protein assembly factor BamB